MKILKTSLILFLSIFAFSFHVLAATNPYGKYQDLYGVTTVRCTWYAWEQAYQNTGVALPGLGNAQNWYANAQKAGYSVGREAKPRSIFVWSSEDGYGHVGYVVSVDGDTMITNEGGIVTTENEGIKDGLSRDTQAINLIGYIYLDEPRKETNPNPSTPANPSTTTPKSSNNNLSSIHIDIEGFTFDKDTKEYQLEVEEEVNLITIQATAEDNKAIVTGTGKKSLVIGENHFILTVTAEDNSKQEYNITIVRKEKEVTENTITVIRKETVENNKKNTTIPIIIGSISTFLFILSTIFMIIKKKKNKTTH